MIAAHKGEITIVVLLLPFMAGIGLGLSYPGAGAIALIIPLLTLSLLFIALNVGYGKLGIYKKSWVGGLLIAAVLLLSGWLVTVQHYQLNNTDHFSKTSAEYLVVHVNSEPKVKGDIVRFTADVVQTIQKGKATTASGTLLVAIKDELATNLFYGEELLIPARYAPVEPPYNPGEFNYKRYLANKNVYHQEFLYPRQYRVIKAGQGNPVIAYALQTRQNLVKKLKANMHDTTAIAVASTLISGYKADLSNDVLQAYSKTGTIHILSVSGGHAAIIFVLLGWALAFLNGNRRGKIIKAITIILLIWSYALLTGFSPAVNRAALMISMVICGKTFVRYINSLNLLAFSAFALLLYDPFLLLDVGFQLSYLAVAGLVVFQPIVYEWLEFKNRVANYMWTACSVSISAQVITFPLSAFYFHQFPLYFLLSNLLIILPIMVIMYAGLLLLLLPQIPYVSAALGSILEHSILLMNKILYYVEQAPYASISKIWLTHAEHLSLYVIIICLFYFMYDKKKKWLLKASVVTILLFCISISLKKVRSSETQSITFLNLRKHTGIVFKNGDSGVVLTDLSDTDKNYQYAVQPGLDSMRLINYRVIKLADNIRLPWFIKQQNMLQFFDKRILLLNQTMSGQSIPRNLHIDYLYISDNPFMDTIAMKNRILIIDGSNSDKYIDKLKNIPVNCKILKRNKSISIASKL
ncbi:ComEC/Rec2 family competence protein [Mucilaginibacter sp.]|uniref:ComEC/Rec2 family competence protein n=1 Tax=Mucilaginibacter sp. TaxID=1882438 RepID=UPI0032671767